MLRRAALLVTLLTGACSLLAPSEDEYFTEATPPTGNGGFGMGGVAGSQFPSAGSSSGGTDGGGTTSGGGAPTGGAPSGGAPTGGGAPSGGGGASTGGGAGVGATCGSCDDSKLCTDDSCVSGNCQHTPNCATSGQVCVKHTDSCPTGQYIVFGQLNGGGCTGTLDTLAECACPCGSPFYTCEYCPPGYTEASSGPHPDCETFRRECVK